MGVGALGGGMEGDDQVTRWSEEVPLVNREAQKTGMKILIGMRRREEVDEGDYSVGEKKGKQMQKGGQCLS